MQPNIFFLKSKSEHQPLSSLPSGFRLASADGSRTEKMSVSSLTTLPTASHSSGGGCVPPPTPTRQPRPGSPWPFSPSIRMASYCWCPTAVMGTSASLLHCPAPTPPHSCKESFHSLLFRSPTWVYVSSQDPDRYTPFLLYSDLPLLSTQSCWVFNQGDSGGMEYS